MSSVFMSRVVHEQIGRRELVYMVCVFKVVQIKLVRLKLVHFIYTG